MNNKNYIEKFGVLDEHFKNLYTIIRLSWYDFKTIHRDSYLGVLWLILNPIIQIGIYWFVFGLGIRNGKPIDGFPYLLWMLSGLIGWFYISKGIIQGANSIYSKSSIVTKMRFPISIIPTTSIIAQLYNHLIMLIIMFIIFVFNKYKFSLFNLQIIYYLTASTIFITVLSWITSVLTMLARDLQKLIQSLIRMLFYLTPILWNMSNLPQPIQKLMNFNPIYYIVKGYRNSLLYKIAFYNEPIIYTVFFWGLVAILAILGTTLQKKFRTKFIDML